MATPRRILVPLDFTGPSLRACDHAVELAAVVGATVGLVHALERFDVPLTAGERASQLEHANRELERVAQKVRPHVAALELLVASGAPADAIVATARDWAADLIVMGTHGRRGLARALLGSVAARVVRTSSVPVTTVPHYTAVSRNAAGRQLASALASVNLADAVVVALSRGALTVATALAEQAKATIDLWGVEPIVTKDGTVLGALGEDGVVELENGLAASLPVQDAAIAAARDRMRVELFALKGARSIGECWKLDVVLVADGLFSSAYARVAIDSIRKLGPARILVASPVIARGVLADLEGKVEVLAYLDRATVTAECVYRDDVLPSDLVAYDLLLAAPSGSRSARSGQADKHAP